MPCGSRHTITGRRAPCRPRAATRQGGRDPTTTLASRSEGLRPGTSSAGVAGARITAAELPSGWCLWGRCVRRTAGAALSIVAIAVTSVCSSSDCDCLTTSCMQTIRFLLPAVSQCRRTKCPGAHRETRTTRDTDQILSSHPLQGVLGNTVPIFPSISRKQHDRKIRDSHCACLL